jgi:hypothetical protein
LINSLKPGVSFLFGKQNKDANGKITSALGMVINALNSLGNAKSVPYRYYYHLAIEYPIH